VTVYETSTYSTHHTRLHRCSVSHKQLRYHITTGIGTRIGIGAEKKYRVSEVSVNPGIGLSLGLTEVITDQSRPSLAVMISMTLMILVDSLRLRFKMSGRPTILSGPEANPNPITIPHDQYGPLRSVVVGGDFSKTAILLEYYFSTGMSTGIW